MLLRNGQFGCIAVASPKIRNLAGSCQITAAPKQQTLGQPGRDHQVLAGVLGSIFAARRAPSSRAGAAASSRGNLSARWRRPRPWSATLQYVSRPECANSGRSSMVGRARGQIDPPVASASGGRALPGKASWCGYNPARDADAPFFGLGRAPCIRIEHLSENDQRVLRLAVRVRRLPVRVPTAQVRSASRPDRPPRVAQAHAGGGFRPGACEAG